MNTLLLLGLGPVNLAPKARAEIANILTIMVRITINVILVPFVRVHDYLLDAPLPRTSGSISLRLLLWALDIFDYIYLVYDTRRASDSSYTWGQRPSHGF